MSAPRIWVASEANDHLFPPDRKGTRIRVIELEPVLDLLEELSSGDPDCCPECAAAEAILKAARSSSA